LFVSVRLGIRAQLLLSMAALLLLAFAPLFFAIASLAQSTFSNNWERSARSLGRAVAGHVSEARRSRDAAGLRGLLDAQLGQSVGAIGIYDDTGRLTTSVGVAGLPDDVSPGREQITRTTTNRGTAMVVVVPDGGGSVATLLYTDPAAVRVGPLVQLIALYIGLLGLGLLVFGYFVLTRIVVAPVEGLRRAARRVADGARELTVPRSGGSELIELGSSLATMTATMRAEEEQLRDSLEELRATTADLRRAQETVIRGERLASVGRLSMGLAHEIGNPIAAILGFQELLLDGNLDDDDREFVLRMKRETERVNRILRDLLDFARPAADGAAEDEATSCSTHDAIEHVIALVKPQRSFENVDVRTDVASGLPPVAMDAQRLEQVLLNILLNAADAVTASGGKIHVQASLGDSGVEVCIEDDGGGIEPSVRDRLFEPFVTTKEVGKGTGLGLAVCRGLIEAAGGTIDAEEGEAGARFVLRLPRA